MRGENLQANNGDIFLNGNPGVEIDEAHLEHPYALLLQPMSQYQV
jgi:hypothetical protein